MWMWGVTAPLVGGIGLIATVIAQAIRFQKEYHQLPAAEGPRSGVALSPTMRQQLRQSAAGASSPREEDSLYSVIFIGDSLVAGVGCRGDAGPALPQAVAQAISEKVDRPVQWHALAVDGGDVNELHAELLPKLEDVLVELELGRQRQGRPPGPRIDVVVLVCGLNDWKRVPLEPASHTPDKFQRDLARLCDGIHKIVGTRVPIILPALPMQWCMAFPQPLKTVLVSVSNVWDSRKDAIGRKAGNVDFLAAPNVQIPLEQLGRMLGADGVHPNERGYKIWGEHMAEQILKRLYKGKRTSHPAKL